MHLIALATVAMQENSPFLAKTVHGPAPALCRLAPAMRAVLPTAFAITVTQGSFRMRVTLGAGQADALCCRVPLIVETRRIALVIPDTLALLCSARLDRLTGVGRACLKIAPRMQVTPQSVNALVGMTEI
jgi:hypothetical protein